MAKRPKKPTISGEEMLLLARSQGALTVLLRLRVALRYAQGTPAAPGFEAAVAVAHGVMSPLIVAAKDTTRSLHFGPAWDAMVKEVQADAEQFQFSIRQQAEKPRIVVVPANARLVGFNQ